MAWALFCAAVTAALTTALPVPEEADAAVFVQTSVRRDCQCLPFREVYAEHKVECGQGPEFKFMHRRKMNNDIFNEICGHFFFHFNERYCVQSDMGSASKDQWCYVSSACQELNGGSLINNTEVSWKVCDPNTDMLLQKVKPMALLRIAKRTGVDPSMLMKQAYPTYKQGLWWPGIQMNLGIMTPAGNFSQKQEIYRQVRAMNEPVFFDSVDGRLPFGAVWGKEVVEAQYTKFFFENLGELDLLYAHPAEITTFSCLKGPCTE